MSGETRLSLQAKNFLELPLPLVSQCLSAAGNPLVFAVCRNLHAHRDATYKDAEKEFMKQTFTSRLLSEMTGPNRVPRVCLKVREIVRHSSLGEHLKNVSPLGAHQAAAVLEDWNMILFFNKICDNLLQVKLEFLLDRAHFKMVMKHGDRAEHEVCIRQTAEKMRRWMQENPRTFSVLRTLKFRKGELTILPPEIHYFSELRILVLRKLNLCYISSEVGSLMHLKEVDFSFNSLSSLPRGFRFLSDLINVQFNSNNFREFPDVLCSLPRVARLGMCHNKLRAVPEATMGMEGLRIVNFSFNEFEGIPSLLAQLPRLFILNMGHNLRLKKDDVGKSLFGSNTLVLTENEWEEFIGGYRRAE